MEGAVQHNRQIPEKASHPEKLQPKSIENTKYRVFSRDPTFFFTKVINYNKVPSLVASSTGYE